jgi:hypothetical protein
MQRIRRLAANRGIYLNQDALWTEQRPGGPAGPAGSALEMTSPATRFSARFIEVTRSLRDRARVFLIGDHEDDDLRALVRAWVA